jgi:hypothetical protein
MTRLVTITLDSGAFFCDSEKPSYIKVGYFCCDSANEILVYVDGEEASPHEYTLKRGDLSVQHLDRTGQPKNEKGPVLTNAFSKAVLRLRELYDPKDAPAFDKASFHCTIRFDSGILSPSVVKPHRFREAPAAGAPKARPLKETRAIAHDILVQFELEDGEVLRLVRDDGTEICSTGAFADGWKWANFQVIADYAFVEKFFRGAVKHTGKSYWLPNPDAPPVTDP